MTSPRDLENVELDEIRQRARQMFLEELGRDARPYHLEDLTPEQARGCALLAGRVAALAVGNRLVALRQAVLATGEAGASWPAGPPKPEGDE